MSFTSRRVREEKKPSVLARSLLLAVPLIQWGARYYAHFKHAKQEEAVQAKREHLLKRTVTVLLAALLVLLLLIGTLKVLVRLKAMTLGMVGMAAAELPVDSNGLTNVLLLGEGNSDHSGIDLTDTVMIASLDPKGTKSAVLLSIPRDTYILKTEKMGAGRINSLYRDYKNSLVRQGKTAGVASNESLRQLATEIGTLFGLELHGAVKVNFSGFEQTVDSIGGIDVVVPEDLLDTQYPGPDYSYTTFSLAAGTQHLDGATALKYARSRHSTSDFSRSARQQQIIAATAKKLKEGGLIKNAGKLMEILSIVSKNVESTFTTRELLGLAEMGKAIETNRIVNMQLHDQNGLFGSLIKPGGFLYAPPREEFEGASVLLPVSIPEFPISWKQVQALSNIFFQKRELLILSPSITVLNAGAVEGSARKLGGELYRYGFAVIQTGNYVPRSMEFSSSFIAVNPALQGEDEETKAAWKLANETAAFLATLLHMKVLPLPETQPPSDNGVPDVTIVLGEDFQYTPLQDLL